MKNISLWVFGEIAVIGLILGLILIFMYMASILNSTTLQTQVINPKADVECVVVNAASSISVDCWKK